MSRFIDNTFDVVQFSLSWIKDSQIYKLFITFFFVSFISEVVSDMFISTPQISQALLIILFKLVTTVITFYFMAHAILIALKKKGFGNINLGFLGFIKYIALLILESISKAFPWMDVKFLVTGIVITLGIVVTSLTILGTIVEIIPSTLNMDFLTLSNTILPLGIGFIFFCLLGLIFCIYTTARLFPSVFLFLGGKSGISDSLKSAWKMTEGRGWETAGFLLIYGSIFFVVFLFINIGIFFVSFVYLIGLGMFLKPVIIFFHSILASVRLFINAYGTTAIYTLLDTQSRQVPQPTDRQP